MEEICIELKFPYGQHDKNGVYYSKEAIKNALSKGISNLPIVYRDNDGNEKVIGSTKNEQVTAEWDDLTGVCKIKVNGVIYFGGSSCIVNEIKNGIVTDFEITSIDISK